MNNTMDNITRETLLITQEECAEVTQAISKVFRFGMDAQYPTGAPTNKQRLEEELGDLQAMILILSQRGIINMKSVEHAAEAKVEKLKKWSNIFTPKDMQPLEHIMHIGV
jgi:NTP pyrophosphatase (non-canonical NTP hydrolase)